MAELIEAEQIEAFNQRMEAATSELETAVIRYHKGEVEKKDVELALNNYRMEEHAIKRELAEIASTLIDFGRYEIRRNLIFGRQNK